MTQVPTQSMFEDNNAANGSNDAETSDESTARKFEDSVRNFLGRLAGDEEESETGDAVEQGESYTPPEEPHYVSQWKLGSHSVPSGISKDEIENEISRIKDVNPDLAGVLEEASSMVEHSETSGYECKVCGLYHAGILTESGSDSTHLAPQTDMWELEPDFGGDL